MKEFVEESIENFKVNVLGIRTDVPGQDKVSPLLIRLWSCYGICAFLGLLGAVLSYGYVGGTVYNGVRLYNMAPMALMFDIIWNFFVALFVSSLFSILIALIIKSVWLRSINDINVFANSMALYFLVYVVVTMLLYMLHVHVPYFFAG